MVQVQRKSVNDASFLALATLHAMKRKETTLLSNVSLLSEIYVDPSYQVLLEYSQKTVAQAYGSIVEALANAAGVRRHD